MDIFSKKLGKNLSMVKRMGSDFWTKTKKNTAEEIERKTIILE